MLPQVTHKSSKNRTTNIILVVNECSRQRNYLERENFISELQQNLANSQEHWGSPSSLAKARLNLVSRNICHERDCTPVFF